ncbi:hypothetical protein [Amaricoccus sp.]|uniref:hypothetical protein n=1 Tax=Amaricoccus sp. TaxID=1872485 RepID=UPI001B4E4B0F|nr:hypothetical protein [Amaricoccus sp.]MBP7002065.1 hypothetical protein [Amaricoccus sp.]
MRPYQARHALASILVNRDPASCRRSWPLLGDRISTVEKTYAGDEDRLVADARP